MRLLGNGIQWNDEEGVGYFPVPSGSIYDRAYFEKYRQYEGGEMSNRLTDFRTALVNRWAGESSIVVDIGIGCGTFVSARDRIVVGRTFGYDVNSHGVRWLIDRDLWWDPWFRKMPSATFWDSLEHVEQPAQLIGRVERFAFVSMPIYEDGAHAERSKHFRPSEHFWYFTRRGLLNLFNRNDFRLADESSEESAIGRQDIRSFVFERVR